MASPECRFMQKVMPEPNSGCWLWVGSTNEKPPYGRLLFRGTVMVAHRVSWLLYRGEIPDGLRVLHRCDVPQCVNPEHLFLGSQSDNMLDMYGKNRGRLPSQTASKLTEDDVRLIRSSLLKTSALARQLGVTHRTVLLIRRGETWGWLP